MIDSQIQSLNSERQTPLRWLGDRFVFAGATVLERALTLIAVGCYIGFRLFRLTRDGLYTDEIFSVEAARQSWSGLLRFVLEDVVHPPLFYLALKPWIAIGGESLFWLRLFPVVTAVLALVPFLLLCRALKLKTGWTAAALWLAAVNPYLVYYSQEVRMYSLAVMLSLWSAWLFVLFVDRSRPRTWILPALTIVNLLLVYTHYYGWLLIGAECLYLSGLRVFSLLWDEPSDRGSASTATALLFSILFVAIGFAPWAYFAWRSAASIGGLKVNLGWNQPPTLRNLLQHFSLLSGPLDFRASTLARGLLFGTPLIFAALSELVAWRKKGEKRHGFWLLATLVWAPVAVVFVASRWTAQSGWLHRSLIVAAAPYFILVPVAVARMRPAWVGQAMMALILCWATAAGVAGARRDEYGSAEGDKRRIKWRAWAEQLSNAETSGESKLKVFAVDLHSAHTLEYYLRTAKDDRFEIHMLKGGGFPTRYPVFAEKKFAPVTLEEAVAMGGGRFWIACRPENRALLQSLGERGYQIEKGPVAGIPGIQYQLNLARLGGRT